MLGYTIDRVDSVDANGLAWDTTYDVLSADGNSMLGGEHPTLRAAQNFVLWHELEVARRRHNLPVFQSKTFQSKTPQAKTAQSGKTQSRAA
ncbi:MAG TPA: hypothetical protein VFI49_08380 [Rudaea sp.]|nr:hypothetical protein [Rudaea sp.]